MSQPPIATTAWIGSELTRGRGARVRVPTGLEYNIVN